MAGALGVLLVAALFVASGEAISSVTLTSIQPPKLSINTSFLIDGQVVTPSTPCTSQALNSPCLPKPHARRDHVMVKYGVLPQYQPNTSDAVQLKACYSPYSQVNRPWRASNNLIARSKTCPFLIKAGLNASGGNATWYIPQNVPRGSYFIRGYVLMKNATDPASPIPVAFGNSMGYFQVIPIPTREKGLVVAAGICICVGPILFTVLMLREFVFMKKRV